MTVMHDDHGNLLSRIPDLTSIPLDEIRPDPAAIPAGGTVPVAAFNSSI